MDQKLSRYDKKPIFGAFRVAIGLLSLYRKLNWDYRMNRKDGVSVVRKTNKCALPILYGPKLFVVNSLVNYQHF